MIIILFIIFIILLGLIFQRDYQNRKREIKDNKKIQIVTSLEVYGEMAKAVVGNKGQVQSIITKSSIDPHEYEPDINTAKTYDQAQLIISNGAGYDSWATKFSQVNKNAQKVNVDQVVNYKNGDNEHFWYQPSIAKKMMNPIVEKLSVIQPKSRIYFQNNAKRYIDSLKPLVLERERLSEQLNGKKIMVTEPVYDNALDGLGVKNINEDFSRAVESGNDPTPKEVFAWNRALKEEKIAFVINNPQTENAVTKQAVKKAQQLKVPIVEVTETKPDNQNYLQWQLKILYKIEEALKK